MFLRINCYAMKKPLKSFETKHEGVQSHMKYTTEDYKKNSQKNAKSYRTIFFWK